MRLHAHSGHYCPVALGAAQEAGRGPSAGWHQQRLARPERFSLLLQILVLRLEHLPGHVLSERGQTSATGSTLIRCDGTPGFPAFCVVTAAALTDFVSGELNGSDSRKVLGCFRPPRFVDKEAPCA